nr:hypothetical protein [Tanacetum cinerariifolium]
MNYDPKGEGVLEDKIICDLDKTTNFSQRSPQNCPKCGNPVKGHYCQACIFCRQCTCELCGNGAHYGYNCPPKVPIIPDPVPFYNQTIKELPPTVQSFDPKPDLVYKSPNTFQRKSFRNPLFEEEILPMKIVQHHYNIESDLIESLRTHDSSIIISSKIDSLLDEFADELAFLKSISPGIDETDCDFKEEISPILIEDNDSLMEEIDLSFTLDYPMPSGIEDDDYDSERDILILKYLVSNDTLSIPEIESFNFDNPSLSRPPIKPPDGNTGILNVKMMGDISEQKVPLHKLMITLAPNQEKSLDHLSHPGLKAFQPSTKFPIMIHRKNIPILDVSHFHFYLS